MADPETSRVSRMKARATALLIAFVLGLVPMAIVAWKRGAEATTVKRELNYAELKNRSAAAALYSRRGEYEKARRVASNLFDQVKTRVEAPSDADEKQKQALRAVLQQRDEIITLLARSDPACVDRLFNIEHQLIEALPANSGSAH